MCANWTRRSRCNSSSRCCHRARGHVDPTWSRDIRCGGDSHPEMPSSPGSVGLLCVLYCCTPAQHSPGFASGCRDAVIVVFFFWPVFCPSRRVFKSARSCLIAEMKYYLAVVLLYYLWFYISSSLAAAGSKICERKHVLCILEIEKFSECKKKGREQEHGNPDDRRTNKPTCHGAYINSKQVWQRMKTDTTPSSCKEEDDSPKKNKYPCNKMQKKVYRKQINRLGKIDTHR